MDPRERNSPIRPWEPAWCRFLWTFIGFAAGTGLMSPLVLSVDQRERTLGGMVYGGVPLGIVGYLYGRRRADRMSEVPQSGVAGLKSASKISPNDDT